jgi:predicted amidohydrolase
MKVSRGLYPQQEFLERRSRRARARVQTALDEPGARGVIVGVCQISNHSDGAAGKESNLGRMLRCVEAATEQGVQVLVFPEMCLPGYFVREHGTPEQAKVATRALADEAGRSPFLEQLQVAAGAAEMVLSFGFSELNDGCVYNAIGVVDADGTWLGARRKNPLSPGPYDLVTFTEPSPAERSTVFRTRYATVGVSNCFDGEFPESVRRMRLEGAELLLWSNAGTGDASTGSSARFNQCGSYAQTNRMWVACCNAVSGRFYGNSCVYAPWGEPLVQLSHHEEMLGVAMIDLALCADWVTWRDRLDFSGLPGSGSYPASP